MSEFGFERLRVDARPFSGQQIVDRITVLAKDDAGEDVGQIGLRIDLEKFTLLDEASDRRPIFRDEIVTCEERIFSLESHRPHRAHDAVVVELEPAIVEEAVQAAPMVERIPDRFRQFQ